MMHKNSGQMDMFDLMIFEKLIPKNHLLIKIDSIFDFSFVYEKVKDKYSTMGRGSKDPEMMVKTFLLEYLYNLSDVAVAERIRTDVAFRWFLRLSIHEEGPDDTTISHFRINRLGVDDFETIFNEIVKQCIEKDIVKSKRYIVDSTDVAANANYPSDKKLIRKAMEKLSKELRKFDEALGNEVLKDFEDRLNDVYDTQESVLPRVHYEIAQKILEKLYLKTNTEMDSNEAYREVFGLCYNLVDRYLNNKKDKIISVTDPEARVAYKSPGNAKKGYKNHIITDEESEIILASVQTPFNVGDEKELECLVNKAINIVGRKPKELSADKVYGTIDNRAYLKDNGIQSNIDFYKETNSLSDLYGVCDFLIAEDGSHVICPNGIRTDTYKIYIDRKRNNAKVRVFYFERSECDKCPLRGNCLRQKESKYLERRRRIQISDRYDAIALDRERTKTEAFRKAMNQRFRIERRFSTMVMNHGLRRCRYIGIKGAVRHSILANIASNLVRAVNILYSPVTSTSKCIT